MRASEDNKIPFQFEIKESTSVVRIVKNRTGCCGASPLKNANELRVVQEGLRPEDLLLVSKEFISVAKDRIEGLNKEISHNYNDYALDAITKAEIKLGEAMANLGNAMVALKNRKSDRKTRNVNGTDSQ